MGRSHLTLDLGHCGRDLRHAQRVGKFEAECRQNLMRCELHRQYTIDFGAGAGAFGNVQNRLGESLIRPLTDQETLAFAREQAGSVAHNYPDENRGDTIKGGCAQSGRGKRATGSDHDADQRGAVLEQADK